MFRKINKSENLDVEKVNEGMRLLNKILKVLFIVLIIVAIMIITYVVKEWKILNFIGTLLKILIPFFIGLFIAWLFNPTVKFLTKHKFNRVVATILVYGVFIIVLCLFIIYSVPVVTNQLNDFINIFPKISNNINIFMDKMLGFLEPILRGNTESLKIQLYDSIVTIGKDITVGLPDKLISVVTSIVSGLGTFLMGLFIGLYMLLDFDNVSKGLINLLPHKLRDDAKSLMDVANKTLVNYIQGMIFTTILVWIGNSIGFSIAGLKAPILFALFCGVTNVIPYVGPYIGGIPAAIVALTQGTSTGIFVIISLVVVQLLDNVIFTPLVQSKGLKLHPVTIIISLLIFGHFFGILGMILAVPVIATLKTIFVYFNKKYEFIKLNEEIEEEIKLKDEKSENK